MIQSAYITHESGVDYLNVIVGPGEFHRFPISPVTQIRLATECASSVWAGMCRGEDGISSD